MTARHPTILLASLLLLAPVAAGAQQPDTAAMARAVGLLDAACAADRSGTWGRPLCGPLLLGQWGSRGVLASRQAADGSWSPVGRWWHGELPAGRFPANTAMQVGGTDWSMVVLPLPSDDGAATALLVHEQFHRIQPLLALPSTDPENHHLEEAAARRLLRLEWRALATAFRDDAESCRAARDALAFRAARHAAYPGSDSSEALLERHEGLAEYTGQRLAAAVLGGEADRMAARLAEAEQNPSYVRSFAYATGAAYGLLLDRADPGWHDALVGGEGPAALLAERLGCDQSGEALATRARRYGGEELARIEGRRADSLATLRNDYVRRLVDGPGFSSPPGDLRFTFDPNRVFPLGSHGVVHPTGTFSGAWGSLEVESGGALVAADYRTVTVALPADGVSRWTLTPAKGWQRIDTPTGIRLQRIDQ
jgi:hypothetical protein